MTDTPNRKACPQCGGPVQGGYVDSVMHSRIAFIIPGEPTRKSPIEAFKQGLQDMAPDQRFALRGLRCSNCGFVEFFADELLP